MIFWDTSAIVPLLLPEATTTRRMRQAENSDVMLVWWGTAVECASAIRRQVRDGKLSEQDAATAIGNLRLLESSWTEIEPTAQVRTQAERLLRIHSLRAADALQLAAAIIATDHDPAGTTFLTGDVRLAEAAAKEGFALE